MYDHARYQALTSRPHVMIGQFAFAALTFPCALIYRRAVRWIVPSALLFGILIELIQPQVGRMGEIADFYADALGAMLGLGQGLAANGLVVRPLARQYLNRYA